MYQPDHFKIEDRVSIREFICQHSFGQLISQVDGRPFVSHLPLLLSPDSDELLAHLARPNPQWQEIEGQEALVTFQGPHAYVSPSWYENAGVPTWNYQVVHIYARARVEQDHQAIARIVEQMTDTNEAVFKQPWNIQYPQGMLKSIVGLRLEIIEYQAKFKLSQNRATADQKNVAEQYERSGMTSLARAMREAQADRKAKAKKEVSKT